MAIKCSNIMMRTVNSFQILKEARRAAHGGWHYFLRNLFGSSSQPDRFIIGGELEAQPSPTSTVQPGGNGDPGSSREGIGSAANGIIAGSSSGTQDQLRRRPTGKDDEPAPRGSQAEVERPKKQRTFFKHIEPKEPFTVRNQLQRTIFGSWINLLLIAAPVGIAINYIEAVSRVAVFVVNFIAIVPLAAMLSFATEEIALRTGETLGGLLNATFGYVPPCSWVQVPS